MKQKRNDGGNAFPRVESTDYLVNSCSRIVTVGGMSLRDYFAAQALAGIMARGTGTSNAVEWAPEEAYAVADAMLSARDA